MSTRLQTAVVVIVVVVVVVKLVNSSVSLSGCPVAMILVNQAPDLKDLPGGGMDQVDSKRQHDTRKENPRCSRAAILHTKKEMD